MRGGDRETATTQVKEVETATGQQGGAELGGQLRLSGQWQMRPVVVVVVGGHNAAPEKAAQHPLASLTHLVRQWQWRYNSVTTLHNFIFHVKDKSDLTGNTVI